MCTNQRKLVFDCGQAETQVYKKRLTLKKNRYYWLVNILVTSIIGIPVLNIIDVSGDLSRAELMMMTIADVIKQLVEAHEEGKDINLNK